MKTLLLLICTFPYFIQAQKLSEFNGQRNKIDQKLMTGLGSWAALNIVGSGIGWAASKEDEMQSFHQMNVMWNIVNLGLAIPGYVKAKKNNTEFTLSESITAQNKTEKIFLFNAGLDFAYITSGFLLRNMAQNNLNRKDQLNGFGSGLVLQGSFLMLFDISAYLIHRNHANKTIDKELKNIQLSISGLGIKLSF